MARVAIADIVLPPLVDAERHLDRERVERHRASLDRLPPVVVFATEEGLVLADGYHRLAAAVQEGRETVEADVRSGSRSDAFEYAVTAAARERGLPPARVREHVLSRYGRRATPSSAEGTRTPPSDAGDTRRVPR